MASRLNDMSHFNNKGITEKEATPNQNQLSIPVETPIQKQPTLPLLLGPQNTNTTCPFCKSLVQTSVQYRTTSRTHITAALLATCCCCCIPYCCNSAKNTDHYCPSCRNYLGTYEK